MFASILLKLVLQSVECSLYFSSNCGSTVAPQPDETTQQELSATIDRSSRGCFDFRYSQTESLAHAYAVSLRLEYTACMPKDSSEAISEDTIS